MTIPSNIAAAVKVQSSPDGVTWTDFGLPASLGSILRSRRFILAPGYSATARYWRIVKTGGYDWAANVVQLDQIAFWQERALLAADEVSQVKLKAFNFDDAGQRYILPMTAGHIEVWRQSQLLAGIAAPYSGGQVGIVSTTQSSDTLLAFHQDTPPWRFMRQGSHFDWDSRALSFDSLPIYDYDGTAIGGVNEVQELFFIDYLAADTFNITLEGQTTSPIVYNATMATLAASIQAALEALPSVGVGQVAVTSPVLDTLRVEFKGKMANADVGDMAPVTLHSTAGGVSVANIVQGKKGGEPVISATRGWPATGTLYQQRLWLAGLKSRPQTFLGSQLGAYFSFDTKGANSAGAVDETLDTDEVTAIRSIFPGQHLQLFSSSAEFFFPANPITPPTDVKQSTKRGVQPGTPQIIMDNATVFVSDAGGALAEFNFEVLKDSYTAEFISLLASHIVKDVIDLGYRKARSTTESDLALMPRATGEAAVMVALRDQDITGFVPWTTQGRFLAAVAEMGGDMFVATARVMGDGRTVRYLERLDPTRLLDCSIAGLAGDARLDGLTLSDVDHLEGMTVCLYIDGADAGDAVVAGGQVVFPYSCERTWEVGLVFQARGLTLPKVFEKDERGGADMAPTVADISFRLGPTSNLKAGLLGGKMWRVPLKARPGALLDQGPGEDAFTGWTRIWGVPGWRPDAQIAWVQERPGPLQIREIVATANT